MRGKWFVLVLSLVAFAAGSVASAALPPRNPIGANIPGTTWSMELADVLTIPNSSGQAPRLEFLTGGGAPGLAYVIDQRGKIYSFNPAAGSPSANLFLDLSASVANFNVQQQTGVRGLAFHPDFNNSGTAGFRKFFTSHSRNGFAPGVGNPIFYPSPPGLNHDSVVGEWTVNANGSVNTGSYREVVRFGQPFGDHNIGQIGFNPNAGSGDADYGNLYVAMGDGGNDFPPIPNDPHNLGQDLSFPHGSLLRIGPLSSSGDPYSLPGDNPFKVSNDLANARNLIWATGLRNPHRFTFDTAGDGKLLISDIGQTNIEEINLGVAGANYGWDVREGTYLQTGSFSGANNLIENLPAGHASDAFTYPVAQYDHTNNLVNGSVAIVGGSVYRGTGVPQLTGLYLFGDFATNSGPILAVDVDDLVQREDFTNLTNLDNGHLAPFAEVQLTFGGVDKTLLQIISDEIGQNQSRSDLRFGVGPDDEIYVLNKRDGVVRKIVSVSGILDGDADRGGAVNGADFLTWQRNANQTGDWNDGDFDGNGQVAGADLALWAAQFGNVAPLPSSTAVPEPSAFAICILSAWMVSLSRRLVRN